MYIGGNCTGLALLGTSRIKGPVDNVLLKSPSGIKQLLENKYLVTIMAEKPLLSKKQKSFQEDSEVRYDYSCVQIVHNNPTTLKYQVNLLTRLRILNNFIDNIQNNKFYLVYSLSCFDVSNLNLKLNKNNFKALIKYLKSKKLLDHTIFVGTKKDKVELAFNWHLNKKDAKYFKRKYHIHYIEILDNSFCNIEATHQQFLSKVKELGL